MQGFNPAGKFHARADARNSHLAGKKRKRSPQIFALLRRHACDGVIGRNIKPRGFSVYQEHILLGALVFPTHFPRPAEVGGSRLGTKDIGVFRVALDERGLERLRCSISCLETRSGLIGAGKNCRENPDERCQAAAMRNAGHTEIVTACQANGRLLVLENEIARFEPVVGVMGQPKSQKTRNVSPCLPARFLATLANPAVKPELLAQWVGSRGACCTTGIKVDDHRLIGAKPALTSRSHRYR